MPMQLRRNNSYAPEPTGMKLPLPGSASTQPVKPKPKPSLVNSGVLPRPGMNGAINPGTQPTFGVGMDIKPPTGTPPLPTTGLTQPSSKVAAATTGQKPVGTPGGPGAPSGGDGGPKPWDEGLPSLDDQESLYADIMRNLQEQRDFMVQQGDIARAGARRQAAYVSGIAGNAFGGALAGGQMQADLNQQRQNQGQLYEHDNRMMDAQFQMLDRRIADEAARRGMSFEDYLDTKNFDQETKRMLMEQEAERQRNDALEDPANFDPQAYPMPPALRQELDEARESGKGDKGDRAEYERRFRAFYDEVGKPAGLNIVQFAQAYGMPTPKQFAGGSY